MDPLDDLAMALAIGLPIVLVSAAGIFLGVTGEAPAAEAGADAEADAEVAPKS